MDRRNAWLGGSVMPLHPFPRRWRRIARRRAHPRVRGWPCGAAEADGAPSPPAEAPPAPALLSPDSRPSAGEAGAAFEALAEGRWRIRFAAGREDLSEAAAGRVGELGRRIAEAANAGRVTVEAQSSGPEADVSAARRLSLGRALAVKRRLRAAASRRPDRPAPPRPHPEAVDAADILPPRGAAHHRREVSRAP
jgi:hypothetical protein